MRNFGKIITVLLTCVLFGDGASAFMIDTDAIGGGPRPEANLSGTPSEASLLTSTVKEVLKNKQTLTNVTDVTSVKQNFKKYVSNLGLSSLNFMKQSDKKKQKIITYSRTIEQSEIANVSDPISVKKAFDKLFFRYPSKNNQTKYAYAQKGEQLKMDTTIEMFITAKEMQKEMRGKEVELFGAPLVIPAEHSSDLESKLESASLEDLSMITQLRLFEKCMLANEYCDIIKLTSCAGKEDDGEDHDGSGDGKNEDMVCFWNSAIKAEKLYDTIMIYNQFVVAMLTQYRSVKGISSLAKIREAQEESDGKTPTSALEPIYYNYGNTKVSQKITADAMFADLSAEERNAEKEMGIYQDILDDPADFSSGDFELSNGAKGYVSVLDSREEGFADLERIARAEEHLHHAEVIHNVLRRLPSYEDIYKNYNYVKKVHETSRKVVAQSGACVMKMLKYYYEDPAEAFFGPNECTLATEDGKLNGKVICHYVNSKAFSDMSESQGLMDVPCPDDASQKCYMSKIDDYLDAFGEEDVEEEGDGTSTKKAEKPDAVEASKAGGILQYVTDLYRLAVDGNAIYNHDTEIALEITSDPKEGSNYTSHVDIQPAEDNMEFDDKTRASKYVSIYKPEEEEDQQKADKTTEEDPIAARRKEKIDAIEGETPEEDASSIYVTERDDISEDDEDTDDDNARDLSSRARDLRANPEDQESKDPELRDEDAQANMFADTQIESILRWTIGKETMSIIAMDLRCGLNIAGGECYDDPIHFSEPIRPFSIWKDEQEFYDQYFDAKYANIKDYLKTMPDIVLLLNVTGLSELPEIKEALEEYNKKEAEDIEAFVKEQDSVFVKIDEEYQKERERLEKEREEYIEKKNKKSDELSKTNSEYNQMAREISGAIKVAAVAEKGKDYNEKLYLESGRDDLSQEDVANMPQTKDSEELQAESEARKEAARKKRDKAKEYAERIEKEIEKLKEKIEKVDEDLAKLHRKYIKDLSDAEYLEMLNMEESGKGFMENRTAFNLNNLTVNGQEINFAEVLPDAGEFLGCVREKLVKIMEKWEEDYEKDSCKGYNYSPKNYVKFNKGPWCRSALKAHRKLIDDLLEFNAGECGGLPEIAGLTAPAPGNALASVCGADGEKCKEAPVNVDFSGDNDQETCDGIKEPGSEGSDNSYFVGLISQPRDFMAPYPAACGLGDEGVPLREAFYFSEDDFDAISLFKKIDEDDMGSYNGVNQNIFFSRRLLVKELLGAPNAKINSTDNYIEGEDQARNAILPRFWKWILLPRTYVQHPFDLAKLIGIQNGSSEERNYAMRTQQEVRRSGLYPCRSLEYDLKGKPTGRVYRDKYGNSIGVPIQYFIDVDSDLRYSIPYMPPEKYTREATLEARVSQHPEWIRYTTVLPDPERASVADAIQGVPECLSLQARVKNPETGEGLRVYDKEADAKMGTRNYNSDYVHPLGDDAKASELGHIFTFYREEDVMRHSGFPPLIPNPYYDIVISQHDSEACKLKCGPNPHPLCISLNSECQDKVVSGPLRMTFNDVLIRSLYTSTDGYGQEDHEEETSLKDLTMRVFPKKNQIGDFLEQVETMHITQNDVLNIEKKVKTTELELADILKDTDFVFGEDFDLACDYEDGDEIEEDEDEDEEEEEELCHSPDYLRLRQKLVEEKDNAIELAMNELKNVRAATVDEDGNDTGTLETIARRRNDVMRRALLYQMDTPEYARGSSVNIEDYPGDLVNITGDECAMDGSEDGCPEMDEKIKAAYADWVVVNETTNAQDKERVKRLKQHVRPYCAVYPHF